MRAPFDERRDDLAEHHQTPVDGHGLAAPRRVLYRARLVDALRPREVDELERRLQDLVATRLPNTRHDHGVGPTRSRVHLGRGEALPYRTRAQEPQRVVGAPDLGLDAARELAVVAPNVARLARQQVHDGLVVDFEVLERHAHVGAQEVAERADDESVCGVVARLECTGRPEGRVRLAAARLPVAQHAGVQAVQDRGDGRRADGRVDPGLVLVLEDATKREGPDAGARDVDDDARRLHGQDLGARRRAPRRVVRFRLRLRLDLLDLRLGLLQALGELRGRGLHRRVLRRAIPRGRGGVVLLVLPREELALRRALLGLLGGRGRGREPLGLQHRVEHGRVQGVRPRQPLDDLRARDPDGGRRPARLGKGLELLANVASRFERRGRVQPRAVVGVRAPAPQVRLRPGPVDDDARRQAHGRRHLAPRDGVQ